MLLKYIVELLVKKYNIEFDIIGDDEIILYDINLYDIDEIELFDMIKYNIIRYDEINNELFIKIDDDEFEIKKDIENIDDLKKLNYEINVYVELLENNNEYIEIYNNTIGMNDINLFIHNYHLKHKNYYSFNLNNDVGDVELLYKFKKIINDNFIDDIEIFIDIDELFDIYYLNYFDNYDVEINDYNNIIIDHDKKIIKNIDDVYNFIGDIIIKYLTFENNDKLLNYDKIIELLNIINYDYKIIIHDNKIYKFEIDDDEFDDVFELFNDDNKLISFLFDNFYYLNIEFDDVFELFDVDDVIEFIENNVDVNYDEIDYDNFIKLNSLFYSIKKE